MVGDVVRGEGLVGAHRLRGRQVAAAGEHRQPLEDALLVVEEQLVAPVDDGAQRLLAGQRRARPAGQQPEPIVQPGGDLGDRERPGAGGRQLDGERQTVESGADVGDRRVVRRRRARAARRRPVARATKRRDGVVGRERRHRPDGLAADAQSLAARGEQPQTPGSVAAGPRRPRRRSSITCSQLSSTISTSRSPITSASRLGSGRSRAAAIAGADTGGVADGSQLDQAPAERQIGGCGPRRPRGRAGSCPPLPARRG